MPSKTSKPRPSRPSPWKATRGCSEEDLGRIARLLARELKPRDRIILEGPLGAGKTTFARLLLEALGVRQPPEGSPSFAIAHEYDSPRGEVVHIDFYRIRSAEEIDEAGIPAYFWERSAIVISEWLSQWPELEGSVLRDGRNWKVELAFAEDASCRDISISLRQG